MFKLDWIWSTAMAPIAPRNLRMSALLVAIYQVLVAHVLFFITLLAFAHAEEVKAMLAVDTADQADCEYYELVPNSMNEVRLKTASDLVFETEVVLFGGTAMSFIYLLSCLSLFVGVFKNRPEPILPWLIVYLLGIIVLMALLWTEGERLFNVFGGQTQYYTLGIIVTLFDMMIWYIVHAFYVNLRQMRKLTEIATVAIPCPPPGTIPFHFRRENMYLGSGGYRHVLRDFDHINQTV